MRDILLFSVIRIGLFLLIWWLLSLTGIHWLFTGILAAVIAMLISVVALGKPRQAVVEDLEDRVEKRKERRAGQKSESELDADEEDALIDGERG